MVQVLGIVAVQLAVTVAFAFTCLYVQPIKVCIETACKQVRRLHNLLTHWILKCLALHARAQRYVQSTPWPFYLSWGLSFGLLLVLACNERLRRK